MVVYYNFMINYMLSLQSHNDLSEPQTVIIYNHVNLQKTVGVVNVYLYSKQQLQDFKFLKCSVDWQKLLHCTTK
jgi:hypothetical protein